MARSAPAINSIRFRHFRERAICCDARGSFSKGVLVHPPFVLEVMICRYVPTKYVAGTVQQRVLISTMRTRDGSRRSKRQKDWCRRCRGTEGFIYVWRALIVGTWNSLHNPQYFHFFASFRLLGSPYQVFAMQNTLSSCCKGPQSKQNLAFINALFCPRICCRCQCISATNSCVCCSYRCD